MSGRPKKEEEVKDLREPTSAPTLEAPAPTEREEERVGDAEELDEEVTAITDLRDEQGQLLPPGMGQRLIGAAVDYMFLETLVLFSVGAALYGYDAEWTPPPSNAPWTPVQFAVISGYLFLKLLLSYVYFGLCYTRGGTTPGKWAVGLRVVDAKTGEKMTSMRKAFLREAIGKPLSVLPLMAGYLIAAFRKDRRALHDLMFDTKVVYRVTR